MTSRRNVELKARIPDLAAALAVCIRVGAEPGGVLDQEDTYFSVPHGRLKLREDPRGAQLIAYHRPDSFAERTSHYRLVPVADPSALRSALADSLGVKVIVKKRRHLYLLGSVRIHVDVVEDLGAFIEFEAVATADSDLTSERGKVEVLRRAFQIGVADLVASSYSDLILTASARA